MGCIQFNKNDPQQTIDIVIITDDSVYSFKKLEEWSSDEFKKKINALIYQLINDLSILIERFEGDQYKWESSEEKNLVKVDKSYWNLNK